MLFVQYSWFEFEKVINICVGEKEEEGDRNVAWVPSGWKPERVWELLVLRILLSVLCSGQCIQRIIPAGVSFPFFFSLLNNPLVTSITWQ